MYFNKDTVTISTYFLKPVLLLIVNKTGNNCKPHQMTTKTTNHQQITTNEHKPPANNHQPPQANTNHQQTTTNSQINLFQVPII